MKLLHGDCLELMAQIPDGSVDMVLCDLPYGTTQNKWDAVIPFDKLWAQYERVIKPHGVIVLTAAQPFTSALVMSNPKLFRYSWIWEKSKATGYLNAKKRPLIAHEDILVFAKETPRYFPQMTDGKPYDKGTAVRETPVYGNQVATHIKNTDGKRYPRSVQYCKTAESEGKVTHPTQKPVTLFEYLVNTYTNEGETVLDNCMGSGTTGVACVNTGRNFVGIEKDDKYFAIAKQRIEDSQVLPEWFK